MKGMNSKRPAALMTPGDQTTLLQPEPRSPENSCEPGRRAAQSELNSLSGRCSEPNPDRILLGAAPPKAMRVMLDAELEPSLQLKLQRKSQQELQPKLGSKVKRSA